MQINDYVLVFGVYEGVLVGINYITNEVTVYCPDYNIEYPYLITTLDNIELSSQQEKSSGLPN